jgi:uncharacterized protein (TIGR03086 family)
VITIQRQIPDSLDVTVHDGADPRSMWKAVRAAALTALRQPGVMERTITGIRGEMPVEMALIPRLSDLTVHTWDLARATGGDERLSPEIAAIILERLRPYDDALRQSGDFGPRIDPPPGADAQVELICFVGRRP